MHDHFYFTPAQVHPCIAWLLGILQERPADLSKEIIASIIVVDSEGQAYICPLDIANLLRLSETAIALLPAARARMAGN